jgi:hypothetical protein
MALAETFKVTQQLGTDHLCLFGFCSALLTLGLGKRGSCSRPETKKKTSERQNQS